MSDEDEEELHSLFVDGVDSWNNHVLQAMSTFISNKFLCSYKQEALFYRSAPK